MSKRLVVAALFAVLAVTACEHPRHNDSRLVCIRAHESGGNYTAQNSVSSASGAYQFIDSTWRSTLRSMGRGGEYSRAKYAPPSYQDMVAYHVVNTVGMSPWRGSGC